MLCLKVPQLSAQKIEGNMLLKKLHLRHIVEMKLRNRAVKGHGKKERYLPSICHNYGNK